MNYRNDPFFENVAPPAMPTFPHMGFQQRRQEDPFALSPFRGGMMMPFGPSPFSMMNGMMMNMDSMMSNMQRAANNGGQCFSSSSTTVMQYSSDGSGASPHVYHAATSTRQGPGGVKETRKAVKDSHSGVQKMAIGHHIGDRSHVIERHVNARTGERAENQEFVNLDDTDAESFSSEWKEKTHSLNHTPSLEQSRRNQFSNNRGLPSSSQQPQNPEPDLLVSGVSQAEGARREGGRNNKRKHRSTSSSGDNDVHMHHTSTTTTSRSPKLSRTKSPPYVPKTTLDAQSHSHSSHTHCHSDVPPTRLGTNPTINSTSTHAKKNRKKTTTFAL